MSTDKSVAIQGGIWTSISTLVVVLSSFVRIVILTRFLDRSDFGLVSIVNTVIGLCITFTDLGFSSAIMYKKNITQKEYSTLFWMQLLIFSFLYLLLWRISPLIASFYRESQLETLIPIAALSIIFQAFGKLYDTVLQKQYRFKVIAIRNIGTNIISLFIAFILARSGAGVYSLIISTLANIAILNIWNFITGMKVMKVVFYCNPKGVLELIKIGVYQTGTRILDFISSKIDIMIIGKFLGTETLGVYDLAKNLVNTSVDLVRTVVSKVALPILSNSNDNDDIVKSRFLLMTKVVAYIAIPVGIAIAIFSKELLWIVYGSSYTDASVVVIFFAFISIFNSICSFYDMLGVAKGKTYLNFYNTIARVAITIPIVYVTSLTSINAVAFGQLVATVIQSIIFWVIVVDHTYPVPFKIYFSQFSKWLFVQLTGFVLMKLFMTNFVIEGAEVLKCCICVFVYLIIMLASIMLFMRTDIEFFRKLFKK